MGKLDYLAALRRALAGLPPETIAKTLAYYEQRFVDGVAAGQTEEQVGRDLDDPRKIALTLRTHVHLDAFQHRRHPASLLRFLVSVTGLAIFNLFMVIPAAVFAALLAALYACALAAYVGGIAVTASGLAGANELVLDGPLKHMVFDEHDRPASVTIGRTGVRIEPQPDADEPAENVEARVLRGAEEAAGRGLHIYTDMDATSRTTQALLGLAMVLVGIALFLLGIVVTRHSVAGLRRYVEMNIALLKGS